MRNFRLIIFIVFLVIPFGTVFSTQTTDYLNYMYFNSHMNHLRATHERGILMNDEELFSIIADFRYAEYSGGSMMSVMYGGGYISPDLTLGIYFLGFTSDIAFTLGAYTPQSGYNGPGFGASGIGLSLYIAPIALITADFTFAFDRTFQYYRVFFPFIRSTIGIGLSPYENKVSIVNNTVIEEFVFTGGSQRFNIIKFDSAILEYLSLGLEYITAKKTLSPIFTFSLHNFISPGEWKELLFDAFVYLRPSIEFNLETVKLAHFEARVKVWFYFPESGFGGSEGNGKYLLSRGGIYCALSYKQPDTGKVEIAGESGLGIEAGIGMAVLDNLNIGLKPDFFNIAYFWNYSEYFETYPIMVQGVRFLMYL